MTGTDAAPDIAALRAIDAAALTLHRPGLDAAAVTGLLPQLVIELGLAGRCRFLPLGLDAAGAGAHDPGTFLAEVRRPAPLGAPPRSGMLEGVLACDAAEPEAQRHVEVLAAHAGIALDAIARLEEIREREEAVRRIAERLQDSLLPPIPELPSTSVAVTYRAAEHEARVGGDFYDVFPLPNGLVLIVVGDVVGKGVRAATSTSLITQTLRALALQDLPLHELLAGCDRQVTFQDSELMATVWCGLYDPATGELSFASLGHPPALLLRGGSPEVIRLELEGLPLGMRDLSSGEPECRSRRLESRDLLVLYTDGVVEASRDFLAGQQALLEAIASRRGEPLANVVRDALDELLADAGHTDDAVMLLMRRR